MDLLNRVSNFKHMPQIGNNKGKHAQRDQVRVVRLKLKGIYLESSDFPCLLFHLYLINREKHTLEKICYILKNISALCIKSKNISKQQTSWNGKTK